MVALNNFLSSPEMARQRKLLLAALIFLVISAFLPSLYGISSELTKAWSDNKNLVAELASLKKDRDALIQQEVQAKQDLTNAFANLGNGNHTEAQVEQWRKQMRAFSKMRSVNLEILERAPSEYKGASKVMIKVTGKIPGRIAEALDFLQMFGYLESYDGSIATVHIR